MEDKIKAIESKIQDVQTEMAVMNATLRTMKDAIVEFKKVNEKLHKIELSKVVQEQEMRDVKKIMWIIGSTCIVLIIKTIAT